MNLVVFVVQAKGVQNQIDAEAYGLLPLHLPARHDIVLPFSQAVLRPSATEIEMA